MGTYIFRFPADMPELTYETLSARLAGQCDHAECCSCWLGIGTTVTVYRTPDNGIQFKLYATTLAYIYADRVEFTRHGDTHQSTREWTDRIVWDNAVGPRPWRVPRLKTDGPGYGGILCLGGDRDKPVEGHTYPADLEAARRRNGHLAELLARA